LVTTEFEYFSFCFALLYDDDDDDDDDPLCIQDMIFLIATCSVSSAMKQNIKILLKIPTKKGINFNKKEQK
jgi:hypothetical protein